MASRPSRTPSIPIPPSGGRPPSSSTRRNLTISEIIDLPTPAARERQRTSSHSHRLAEIANVLSASADTPLSTSPGAIRGSTSRSFTQPYTTANRPSARSWSTAATFEPRVVRGASHGSPGLFPSDGVHSHPHPHAHRPPLSTSPVHGRRMSTSALRGASFGPSLSPSAHHGPGAADHTPQTCPVPAYLGHSSLRHLLQTEEHDKLPPSRYATEPSGVESGSGHLGYRRATTPMSSVSDSDDDDAGMVRRTVTPPIRSSPTPVPTSLDMPLKLPTRWSDHDRQVSLSVSYEGRELAYNGLSREDQKEAGAARADHFIPPACGIYYFETKILSKGLKGHISIGLCTREVRLTRLPGWEKNSWGYHGDDGHSFGGEKNGSAYGPTFGTGDVIGCGVDFSQNRMFYTKNGLFLGMVFENVGLSGRLYPCIGMRTQGESLRVNFGQEAYKFDIDAHFSQRRNEVWAAIQSTRLRWTMEGDGVGAVDSNASMTLEPEELPDLRAQPLDTNLLEKTGGLEEIVAPEDFRKPLNRLVLSYLAHHGYSKTAQALQVQCERDERKEKATMAALASAPNSGSSSASGSGVASGSASGSKDVEMSDARAETNASPSGFDGLGPGMHAADVQVRTRIVRAVTAGDIDTALVELQSNYPGVLSREEGLMLFKMRCQKFVELMGLTWAALKRSREEKAAGTEEVIVGNGTREEASGSGTPDGYDADVASAMEVDDDNSAMSSTPTNGFAGPSTSSSSAHPQRSTRKLSMRGSLSPATAQHHAALKNTLTYGKTLKADYGKDHRAEVQHMLKQVFNLVAYNDPQEGGDEVQELVGQEARLRLANDLNLAILESQGRPSQPTLERVYRQVNATILQLGVLGIGAAAFADVRKEFLDG